MPLQDVGQPGKLLLDVPDDPKFSGLPDVDPAPAQELISEPEVLQLPREVQPGLNLSTETEERELLEAERDQGLPVDDVLDQTSSFLDQLAYPGNRTRAELARQMGRLGLTRSGLNPEDIPQELQGEKLLETLFDYKRPDGEEFTFKPDPQQPWLPQAIEFVSKVPGTLLKFEKSAQAEFFADSVTDPLSLLGIGLMSKLRTTLGMGKSAKEIQKARDAADEVQRSKAGLSIKPITKQYQDTLKRLKTRDPELEQRAADILKNDPNFAKKILDIGPNSTFNDAELTASIITVHNKTEEILTVIEKFGPGVFADPKNAKLLVNTLADLAAFESRLTSIESAVGASLKAIQTPENMIRRQTTRELSKLFGAGITDPVTMAKQLSKVESGADIARLAKQLSRPGWQQMYNELLINSLLSGPITLLGLNPIGNTLAYMQHLSNRQLAGLFGRGGVPMGEAGRMMMASFGALPAATRTFFRTFRKSNEDLDKLLATGEAKLDVKQFAAIKSENFPNAPEFMKSGIDWFGSAVRIPTRVMMAQDEFFKAVMYQGEIAAQAGRVASETPGYAQLGRSAKAARREEILEQMIKNPDEFALADQAAKHTGLANTFTAELGKTGKNLLAITNDNAYLKMIFPFVRTPINVLKRVGNDLPLGIGGHAKLKAALKSENKATRDEALGRLSFSTMLAGTMMSLTLNGVYVGGRGPNNPQNQRVGRTLQEKTQGSLAFDTDGDGTADHFIELNTRTPLGMTMNLIGSVTEGYAFLQEDNPEAASQLATEIVLGVTDLMEETPYLEPIGNLFEMVHRVEREGVEGLNDHIKRTAPTYLFPILGGMRGQLRRAADLDKRALGPLSDAETMWDNLKNQTPGLSTELAPIHDMFGNVEHYPLGLAPDFVQNNAFGRMSALLVPGLNMMKESTPKDRDQFAIAQWMIDNDFIPRPPKKKIMGIEIPHNLYQQWMKQAGDGTVTGDSMTARLLEVVNDPDDEPVLQANGESVTEQYVSFQQEYNDQYAETLEELLDSPEWAEIQGKIEALEDEIPEVTSSTNRLQRKTTGIKLNLR